MTATVAAVKCTGQRWVLDVLIYCSIFGMHIVKEEKSFAVNCCRVFDGCSGGCKVMFFSCKQEVH